MQPGGRARTQTTPADETAEDAALLRRFKLLQLIGLGNYARVYRATPTDAATASSPADGLDRELAIKSINLGRVSENYRTKFLPRELSILKRAQHANICKVYEIFQVTHRIFIVMQFCSRGTITDLLQRLGPLSEPVARNLFVQVADAVVYLHALDFAHRDIKVENILLDGDFVPKLTDFSYSVRLGVRAREAKVACGELRRIKSQKAAQNRKSTSRSRLNETFCGTLPYLAPEMIRQIPYDSKKADVWSLGVSLYVMLNDRIPFPIDDIKETVRRQLSRDYKFKAQPQRSDKCLELVGLLLEPDFYKRITSQEASRHAWMSSGPREKPPA